MALPAAAPGPAAAAALVGEWGRYLLPAEDPPVVTHFADALMVAHGSADRLSRAVLRRTSRAAALLLRRRRPMAVGARGEPLAASAGREGPEWADALALLREALADGSLLAEARLDRRLALRWIVLRDYEGTPRRRLVVFLFGAGDVRPVAVMKLRRVAEEAHALGREWEALHHVRSRLSPEMAATVPRPLAFRAFGGTEAMIVSALPGRTAHVEMRGALWPRLRVLPHFRCAAAWLARFHGETRGTVVDQAAALESRLEAATLDAAGARRRAELLLACRRSPAAVAAGHGDFWARNLLLGPGGGASVVDWEHAAPGVQCFEDLFHFPLTYGLDYPWPGRRRVTPADAFRLTFIEDTPVSRAVGTYLAEYCAAAGIEAGTMRPLLHLYLLTRPSQRLRRTGLPAEEEGTWLRLHEMLAGAARSVFSG